MTKPWDLQDLASKAKAKFLPIAALLAGDVIDWTGESLALSENNYVKIVGNIVKSTKEPIMAEINKSIQGAPKAMMVEEVGPAQ